MIVHFNHALDYVNYVIFSFELVILLFFNLKKNKK